MLKFGYYTKNEIDRAWFDSSNVVYGECDDSSNTQQKTVRIVFKNGSIYQYEDVNVYDWTLFKNSDSQGKKLNEIFKKAGYAYQKLEDTADVEELNKECNDRMNYDFHIVVKDNNVSVFDNKDNSICNEDVDVSSIDTVVKFTNTLLEGLNNRVKISNNNGNK